MNRRENPIPDLNEPVDGYDGDILGGIMASVDAAYKKSEREKTKTVTPSPISSNKNSLEAIGADNFRGLNEESSVDDLGIDNFRGKPEA